MLPIIRYGILGASALAIFVLGYRSAFVVPRLTQPISALLLFGTAGSFPSTRASADSPPPLQPKAVKWDRNPHRPLEGLAAQEKEKKALGEIENAIVYYENNGFDGDRYFTRGEFINSSPGLCQATSINIENTDSKKISLTRYFLVVGKFEKPFPTTTSDMWPEEKAKAEAWNSKFSKICAEQHPPQGWFTFTTERAEDTWYGDGAMASAQLLDGVIATVRSAGAIPFALSCTPSSQQNFTCDSPRSILSQLDPGGISSIEVKYDSPKEPKYQETIIHTKSRAFRRFILEIHQDLQHFTHKPSTASGAGLEAEVTEVKIRPEPITLN